MWILRLVGSPKMVLPVVLALVVILASFFMIQYGKNIEGKNNEIEQLDRYINTREKIDESIKNSDPSNPTDPTEWLRDRQTNR
jgi:hypothetical protein